MRSNSFCGEKKAAFSINQSVHTHRSWEAKPEPTSVETVNLCEWLKQNNKQKPSSGCLSIKRVSKSMLKLLVHVLSKTETLEMLITPLPSHFTYNENRGVVMWTRMAP